MSKKFLSLFILIAALGVGCGVQPSGKIETSTRPVQSFHALSFNGYGNLVLTQGDVEGLKIEADSNILPLIETEVKDGVLEIRFHRGFSLSGLSGQEIHFYLNFKNLDAIDVSGAADVETASLKTNNLNLNVNGAGSIQLSNLASDHLQVEANGASKISLSGKTSDMNFNLAGAGVLNGEHLESKAAKVSIEGAGKATLSVSDSLDAEVAGAGSIQYYGNPKISRGVVGVGIIRQASAAPPGSK